MHTAYYEDCHGIGIHLGNSKYKKNPPERNGQQPYLTSGPSACCAHRESTQIRAQAACRSPRCIPPHRRTAMPRPPSTTTCHGTRPSLLTPPDCDAKAVLSHHPPRVAASFPAGGAGSRHCRFRLSPGNMDESKHLLRLSCPQILTDKICKNKFNAKSHDFARRLLPDVLP